MKLFAAEFVASQLMRIPYRISAIPERLNVSIPVALLEPERCIGLRNWTHWSLALGHPSSHSIPASVYRRSHWRGFALIEVDWCALSTFCSRPRCCSTSTGYPPISSEDPYFYVEGQQDPTPSTWICLLETLASEPIHSPISLSVFLGSVVFASPPQSSSRRIQPVPTTSPFSNPSSEHGM